MDIRSMDPKLLLANFFLEPSADDDLDDAGVLVEDVAFPVPIPTDYYPGTAQKVAELRRRFEFGYQLHNPHDNPELIKLVQAQKFVGQAAAGLTIKVAAPVSTLYVLAKRHRYVCHGRSRVFNLGETRHCL